MSTVWITQEGRNDYAPAEEFGTVHFITKHDWTKMHGQQNNEIETDISFFLASYIPGKDYIVMAGNPMLVAKVIMSVSANWPGLAHQFLKWDGRMGVYIPYVLTSTK